MKIVFTTVVLSLLLLKVGAAADAAGFSAVQRADEQRIAAIVAGDISGLGNLLSADLRYAQSDGRVQTKAQFLAATADSKLKYVSVRTRDLNFQKIAPGAVAMDGVAQLSAKNGTPAALTLRFLAVWRYESDQWRLLSYQSAQLPTPP